MTAITVSRKNVEHAWQQVQTDVFLTKNLNFWRFANENTATHATFLLKDDYYRDFLRLSVTVTQ